MHANVILIQMNPSVISQISHTEILSYKSENFFLMTFHASLVVQPAPLSIWLKSWCHSSSRPKLADELRTASWRQSGMLCFLLKGHDPRRRPSPRPPRSGVRRTARRLWRRTSKPWRSTARSSVSWCTPRWAVCLTRPNFKLQKCPLRIYLENFHEFDE